MDKTEIKKFFNAHADAWDENMICDEKKIEKILDAAKIEKGKTVLDIACGTGVMFDFYINCGVSKITGADISEKMAEIAKKKYENEDKINVICADAETYDFKEKYDCCMVFNAFPHFPNPDLLIKNLSKTLKNGGTLTIAHDRGRKALDTHHSGEASKISTSLISENELSQKLKSNGFSEIFTVSNDEIYIVSGYKL